MPFLLGAIVLIVLLVGGLLRSYWAAALAGGGIALTLIWARMITNSVGFNESIILDVIVPIATISFGVDFLIHAVGRVREELAGGARYRSAYAIGMAAVGGALVLALSTSSIAFASNATSSIPAVTEFGFGAAIALASAFLILGVLAPLFLLRIEETLSGAPAGRKTAVGRVTSVLKPVGASLFAGVAIIAVIALPIAGVIALVLYSLIALALPLWWSRRRVRRAMAAGAAAAAATPNTTGESFALAGSLVASIVRMRYAAIAVVAIVTVVAGLGALQVERKQEPSDFFPSSSDFIASIDKLIEHSSTASPGDVIIYLEGDLADPRTLVAAEAANASVDANGGDLFARNPDGSLAEADSALDIARAGVGLEFARTAVAEATGVALTDQDGDGFPDSARQLQALFAYVSENGLPADAATFVYTADEVGRLLQPVDGGGWATVLSYPIQGFPDTSKVERARSTVESSAGGLTQATAADGLMVRALISGDIDAAQAMIYNEYAQVLETINPDTGELYQHEDLNIINWNDEGTAMLQDALWADADRLESDADYRDVAVRFVEASIRGWAHCRDNSDACVDVVLNNVPTLGESHQAWQLNEISSLIWPSPLGAGVMDPDLWTQTVDVATGESILSAAPDDGAYRTDIAEEALANLRDQGVDVIGSGFERVVVELREGGE